MKFNLIKMDKMMDWIWRMWIPNYYFSEKNIYLFSKINIIYQYTFQRVLGNYKKTIIHYNQKTAIKIYN